MRKTSWVWISAAAVMLLQTGLPALGQTPKQRDRTREAEVLERLRQLRPRIYGGGAFWWSTPPYNEAPQLPAPRRSFGSVWRFGRPFLTPPAVWWVDPWSGKRLKELGLTDQQRREIAEVLAKHARERFLVLSDPSLQLSDKLARLRQLRDETRKAMENILTPEQKEKLRQGRPPAPPRSRKKPA